MELARFSVIVGFTVEDGKFGIGKGEFIPWPRNTEDMNQLKTKTIGNGSNCLIMGRKTSETLPKKNPLPNRANIVVSRSLEKNVDSFKNLSNEEIIKERKFIIVSSLIEALEFAKRFAQTWIFGGEEIYTESLTRFKYLCDEIHYTVFPGNYSCDKFFYCNFLNFELEDNDQNENNNDETERSSKKIKRSDDKVSFHIQKVNIEHEEKQYLRMIDELLNLKKKRKDRTNVGTQSIFSQKGMTFDLSGNVLPIFTTKKMFRRGILEENALFFKGKTDSKILEAKGVNIWKKNTSKEELEKKGLKYREGDMGPVYGFQWRHFGAEYYGCDHDYTGRGFDQLEYIKNKIINEPHARDLVITSYNPKQVKQGVLSPCHMFMQFYVDNGYLDLKMYQRSADQFLGVPFNVSSYCVILIVMAKLTNLKPRYFYHEFGDSHIYLNHLEQVREQLKRNPYPFPKYEIANIKSFDDFTAESIKIIDYRSHPEIKGEMAV